MPTSIDRLVLCHPHRGWEVKAPGARGAGLFTTSRSEALQWAWNIVRTTGGTVILHRGDGRAG